MKSGGGEMLASRFSARAATVWFSLAVWGLLFPTRLQAAAPEIAAWASTGGQSTNKDNDQDIMYLVEAGDAITFTATVNGATAYEWEINKKNQNVAADTFTFTVPAEKAIWEILLKATNPEGEARLEWVISTWKIEEAPAFFEFFSDGKLQNRSETDPWGRALPEWDVEGVWDSSALEARTGDNTMAAPSQVTTGTWKFRFRYLLEPPRDTYAQGWWVAATNQQNGSYLRIEHPSSGRWWFDYLLHETPESPWLRVPHGYPYVNMVGSDIDPAADVGVVWHEVVLIRDERGYLGTWFENDFVDWTRDRNLEIGESTALRLAAFNAVAWTVVFDDVEVYENRFMVPGAGISYDQAEGRIVVNDCDVDLQRIAIAVNARRIFEYDPSTRTALCFVDLLIKSGAELDLKNATLKMDSGRNLLFEREAMFFLDGSTITSIRADPWFWRITGSTAYAALVIDAVDSKLDNFGGFTTTGVNTLSLKNVAFTNLSGATPIDILFRRPSTGELQISGCRLKGKTGAETIHLQGGDQFQQVRPEPLGLDVVDTVFENLNLSVNGDDPYYLSPGNPGRSINFVNSQPGSFTHNGGVQRFKYYLDVKVIDSAGNAVPGATVTLLNEQDNVNNPAENLARAWGYLLVGDQVSASGEAYFEGQLENRFRGLVDGNNLPSATTEANGHTPLPSNATGTLVVTGRREEGASGVDYTYFLAAMTDVKLAGMAGLAIDETWYRPDPGLPTKTVVCNIDRMDCQVAEASVGEVTARVIEQKTGQPIARAAVTDGWRTFTTDAAGTCTFGFLEGEYTLTASAPNYLTLSQSIQVAAGDKKTIDFALQRSEADLVWLNRGNRTPSGVTVKGPQPVAVLQLGMTTKATGATLERLRLKLDGFQRGAESSGKLVLGLFPDADGDGRLDPADAPLAEVGAVDREGVEVLFDRIGQALPSDNPQYFLVTVAFDEMTQEVGATESGRLTVVGCTILFGIVFAGAVSLRGRKRSRRRAMAWWAAALLLTIWLGCGKFGFWGMGGATVAVEANIDVTVTKEGGRLLPIDGAPIESQPFRILPQG